jgi:hypothetical protein
MCPGRDNAVWQAPVDEEAAAAAAEAAEAAEAAGVGGAVAVPEVAAEAMAAAEAAAAAVREGMACARMRRAAVFLLAGVRRLSVLIASTEQSCGMLESAIGLLHEAAQELHLPLSDAGWILALPLQGAAAGVLLQGPIPASMDAARRIVGRLCGTLPPDSYLQIYDCSHHLSPIQAVYAKAYVLILACAEILDFADEGQPWRRWSGRMNEAFDQPSLVQKSLLDAHNWAKIAYSDLLNLVELWNAGAAARMDLPGTLSSAEVNLDAAAELMDQAVTAMGRMSDALELQAYELMILARNPEDQA